MLKKKKVLKGLGIITGLVILQTLTYLYLGPHQLKSKLLPPYFVTLQHQADSLFVRDFYVTDCPVESVTYSSHGLVKDSAMLKVKLRVDFIHFDKQENFSWADTTEKNFKFVYSTWYSRSDWVTLFGFYSARQTEMLSVDNRYFYNREVTYHWFLFFWVKTFEWLESGALK